MFEEHDVRFTPGLNMLEDMSVLYKLLFFAKKLVCLPEALYFYNRTNQNAYSSIRINRQYEDGYLMLLCQMAAFREQQHISDPALTEAFRFFKARIMASMLLYGHKELIRTHKDLFREVGLREFMTCPNFPPHFKAVGAAYALKMGWGVSLLRALARKVLRE